MESGKKKCPNYWGISNKLLRVACQVKANKLQQKKVANLETPHEKF